MGSNPDPGGGLREGYGHSPGSTEESSRDALSDSSRHSNLSRETATSSGLIHGRSDIAAPENEQISQSNSVTVVLSNRSRMADRQRHEKWYRTFLELIIPFVIAGLGMVFAGLLLEIYIKTLNSFMNLRELTVLVPPLMGLKGNLEMTLVARLSTLVNLGNLKTCPKRVNATLADLALSQVQSIVVGFLAAIVSIGLHKAAEEEHGYQISLKNMLIICSSSILTASMASLFLGVTMATVVFLSEYCNVNPDNISTPIAFALGDIVTLNILAWSAELLYVYRDEVYWLPPVIIGFYAVLIGFVGYYSYRDPHTKPTLIHCWAPLTVALLLSICAGLLFEYENKRFSNISLYEPVISGVGGNLVSVQYNRISTAYNRDGRLGKIPPSTEGGPTNVCLTPYDTYFRLGKHSSTAWVLLGIGLPGHALFAGITVAVSHDHVHVCYQYFIIWYLLACMLQIAILIYSCHVTTNFFWKHNIDPDSYVIPLLTAMGDVIGILLLAAVFEGIYYGECSAGRTPGNFDTSATTMLNRMTSEMPTVNQTFG